MAGHTALQPGAGASAGHVCHPRYHLSATNGLMMGLSTAGVLVWFQLGYIYD